MLTAEKCGVYRQWQIEGAEILLGADEIANAIHRMVDTMQLVAAQPRVMITPVRLVTMEDFMRHKPTKFTGKATPDEADA